MENQKIKINCARAEELMGEYIDGDLSHENKADLEAHISSCEHCKSDFEKLEKTVSLLRGAAQEPPAELYGSVMEKIKAEKKSRTALWRKIGTAVAAAFVLVSISTYVMPDLIGGMDSKAAPDEDMAEHISYMNDKSLEAEPGQNAPSQKAHVLLCSFADGGEINSFDSQSEPLKIANLQSGAIALVHTENGVIAYDLRNAGRVYLRDLFEDLSYVSDYVNAAYGKDISFSGDEDFELSPRGVKIAGEYVIGWDMIPDATIEKYMLDKSPMITDHVIGEARYETVAIGLSH